MKRDLNVVFFLLVLCMTALCSSSTYAQNELQKKVEPEKGPHQGRLLQKEDFVLELAIVQDGMPPEFRVWINKNDQLVNPNEVSLEIVLTRLGGVKDYIKFKPQDDFLRGNGEIYEPHSFVVTINAEYEGEQYKWEYENFEGRTLIKDEIAKSLNISTEIAGASVLNETIQAYGKLAINPEMSREIIARYDGRIENIFFDLGQKVKKGDKLITIENNESLEPYTMRSPIDGVMIIKNAYQGEQTSGRSLLMISNINSLIAELSIFPKNQTKVSVGNQVSLKVEGIEKPVGGVITYIDRIAQPNQSITVRVLLKNKNEILAPGAFVNGNIAIKAHHVPLAVKRSGLQRFRDFTVVYAKVGEEYEVRMLELGRKSGDMIEVLGGLEPGTEYVAENSYIIKADIEKSGASHDH